MADQVAAMHERLKRLAEQESGTDGDRVLLQELSSAHEELRVADEELRAQQQELDRLLELRAPEGTGQDLLARLPVPVVLTDGLGAIRSGNAAAASLLGVGLHRLARKPIFAFVDPSDRLSLRRRLAHAVADDVEELRARFAFVLRDRDPVELDVTATLQRSYDAPGGVEVTWFLLGATGGDAGQPVAGRSILAGALVELARIPLGVSAPVDTAQRAALLCQDAFPVPVKVSITVGDPLTPDVLASDSSQAQVVDGAQLMAGEGPCVDAWRSLEVVSTRDMRADTRWPRLARHLGDVELRSAVAAALVAGDQVIGVLNVYAVHDELDGDVAREAAELVAATTATVIQEVQMRADLQKLAEQLQTALESRAVIDQAKGIVMARHACDADEAFRVLVKVSSNSNVKLRAVAADLVAEASARRRRA